MPLTVTSEFTEQVAKITLVGELDMYTAPLLQAELEKAAAFHPKHLVLMCAALTFLASAGVRMLVMARQKIGGDLKTFVIAPTEKVLGTLKSTGLTRAVTVADSYP